MSRWRDVINDDDICRAQDSWDRRATIARLRRCGLTFDKIGALLGITRERVRQLSIKQLKDIGKPSPVEKYLSNTNIRAEVFSQIEATSATQSKKYKERNGVYLHSLVVY